MRFGMLHITFLLSTSSVVAQDVHFSQFYQSPLMINPAQAGAMEDDQRFIINYKNQWESIGATYRTYSASYDLALFKGKLDDRYIGLGVSAYSDKAGTSEFGNTQANLSIAYNMHLNDLNQLSFAIQGGYGQRSAQLMNLRWDSQYTGSNYDPTLPSGEAGLDQQASFIDLGAGILWRKETGGGIGWKVGGSVFHANEPELSLIGTTLDTYLMKYVIHGGGEFGVGQLIVKPKFFAAKQGGAEEINFGGLLERRFGTDSRYTRQNTSSSAMLGIFHRWKDAIIPTMLLKYKRSLSIGISYDVNVSRLSRQTDYRGGIEISLGYHKAFSDSRRRIKGSKVVK